jgi:hypothetical protein
MNRLRQLRGFLTDAAKPLNVLGLVGAACLVVLLYLAVLSFSTQEVLTKYARANEQAAVRVADVSEQTADITCAIAKLVAYVPALQFEGEPQDNFVNWIEARRELLLEAQEAHGCDPTVEAILRERVAQDQKLLDELRPRP